jgi:predicted dehydrogenase
MRKIRMGMIGGGEGAFIGGVHRMAAALDGQIELVCGAFSSDAEKSRRSGAQLYLAPDRVYPSFEALILGEKALPESVRMDFVSIVTPNHVHFAPAKMALENGFHVVCDKPLCLSLEEAEDLKNTVEKTGLLFALTHNYTGYPMVKHARDLIQRGELGTLRRVMVEYPQGWLSTKLEDSDQKQAAWRTDPARSGIVGAMGDIGTHAENLAEYMTGLRIERLFAQLNTFVEGRQLDDDAQVLLEFQGGAKGSLLATQVAAGEENSLNIRIWGTRGGLSWQQMEPNSLVVKWLDQPQQVLRTGVGALSQAAQLHTRLPAGHPEGYLEAFANIYRNFAHHVQARLGKTVPDARLDFPEIADAVRGMNFIYKVVASAKNGKWVNF